VTGSNDTSKTLLWVLLGVVALAALTSLFGGWTGWGSWGWGMMGFMWVWMLVPILLVAWLISMLVDQGRPQGREDALQVAARRYAGGQITREEFELIRDDLGRRPR
jgi:uncharacterized membrane protein